MAAPLGKVLLQFTRLRLQNVCQARSFVTQGGPKYFWATPVLSSAPMKKKKKADPAIQYQRDAKKRRRIEKAIRRLETKGRKLKPIDEIEGDRSVLKTAQLRQRELPTLTFEESERRALLVKHWATFKKQQHICEMAAISTAMASQDRALQELRKESEELYQQAIEIDPALVPFERSGPVATPPMKGYDPPDGESVDTTRVFDK